MEVCQSGYYTEDFRTQEVPAGFDFASYGEFSGSSDVASSGFPADSAARRWNAQTHQTLFFMFVRSVSSEAERLKDRGNMFADSVITSVRAFSASPWHARDYVCVKLCERAEICKDRETQGGQVKDGLCVALPSLSFLILSSRLPPPTDLEPSPPHSPSLHHYSVTLPPLAFPPPPCFVSSKLPPSIELKKPGGHFFFFFLMSHVKISAQL